MGYDFYRRDNLREPRSYSGDGCFRAANDTFALIYGVMSAFGILDEVMQGPEPKGASEETRALRSADPALVPAYKFLSNDGWIVTPEECDIVASALERGLRETRAHLEPSPEEEGGLDFLDRFARFNRAAQKHGGYVVA